MAPAERNHPLTYQTGMRHVRDLWAKASSEDEALKYGLHGLRVLGYTLAKRGAGETLAVAQGGWRSDTHERYERFTVAQVLALPSAMLAADASGTVVAAAVPVTPAVVAQPAAQPPQEQPVAPRPMASPRSGRGAARHSPLPTPPRVEERRASAVLSPPRPLTFANAPGRRVLAPAAMWPRYLCREHGGEGWEAKIEKVRSRDGQAEALVVFVARKTRSTGWQPMWLKLANLRPLH